MLDMGIPATRPAHPSTPTGLAHANGQKKPWQLSRRLDLCCSGALASNNVTATLQNIMSSLVARLYLRLTLDTPACLPPSGPLLHLRLSTPL